MSPSYLSTLRSSSSPSPGVSPQKVETPLPSDANVACSVEQVEHPEDPQQAYSEKKDSLLHHLQSTKQLLQRLKDFNKNDWVIRYPRIQSPEPDDQQSPTTPIPDRQSSPDRSISEAEAAPNHSSEASAEEPQSSSPKVRATPRRSLTFADSPNAPLDVGVTSSPSLQRSYTLPPKCGKEPASLEEKHAICETSEPEEIESTLLVTPASEDFQVLRLDLKLGHSGVTTTASPLVSQLEKSSIAALLEERITSSMAHIDNLATRLQDKSSKVLVTGDLNAGKSTLVNALLKRDVMPIDQQPCTNMFCEVHDAVLENAGKEEAHVVQNGVAYNINDESTFTRVELKDLYDIVSESETIRILKLYVADTSSPESSLLHNGVVDISLIDAPGLNRDSFKTMAVFSRQPEIDVIVFCVSAENHFTQSAKEFIESASREKAHIFIVVNKFDQIRNKEKCKRMILEQVQQASPGTYEDAEDLVHFVDSSEALAKALTNSTTPDATPTAFSSLEEKLRNFVLFRRTKSKLSPASNYLVNILQDIAYLCSANAIVASRDLASAEELLDREKPVVDQMKAGKKELEQGLENEESEVVTHIGAKTRQFLDDVLARVGDGQLGITKCDLKTLSKPRPMPSLPYYSGILNIFDYAQAVRQTLLESIDIAIRIAEDDARTLTTQSVDRISTLRDRNLPAGTERSQRVFQPAVMFSQKNKGKSDAVVAGGTYGLGIGLASNPKMLEVKFTDILDIQHALSLHLGDSCVADDQEDAHMSILSLASLGVSAFVMIGGKTLGFQGLIAGLIKVGEIFENETSRKWVAPVLGVATVGLGAYIIIDLPNSIPRNVGRRIQHELTQTPTPAPRALSSLTSPKPQPLAFVPFQVERITTETRKVLRLASLYAQDDYGKAMEVREQRVQRAEKEATKAAKAKNFFESDVQQADEIRRNLPAL